MVNEEARWQQRSSRRQQQEQHPETGHGNKSHHWATLPPSHPTHHSHNTTRNNSISTMTSTMTSQDAKDFKNNADTFTGDSPPPVGILRKTSSVTSVRGVNPSTLEER